MGYIIVRFPEDRQVIIDDVESGHYTGHVIEVEDGKHRVKLSGVSDYQPPSQTVMIQETGELDPLNITFEKAEA